MSIKFDVCIFKICNFQFALGANQRICMFSLICLCLPFAHEKIEQISTHCKQIQMEIYTPPPPNAPCGNNLLVSVFSTTHCKCYFHVLFWKSNDTNSSTQNFRTDANVYLKRSIHFELVQNSNQKRILESKFCFFGEGRVDFPS